MILHYIKIAFRNMWKYKSQTMISLVGLAVGFTCFALGMLWIRYETTFDTFHRNAKQMYVVYLPSKFSSTDYSRNTFRELTAFLKESFPEIVNITSLIPPSKERVMIDGTEFPALIMRVDSSFFRLFGVEMLEGNWDFLIPENRKIAITKQKAMQLFGNENPIGKTVQFEKTIFSDNNELMIGAIISGMPRQSNYAFDLISAKPNFTGYSENTIFELLPGTNMEAFEKKLFELYNEERGFVGRTTIKSITKIRYTDPDTQREVNFQHILMFAVSGLLVVMCSLFNYLTLYMSRFRIRQKELALRVVCGASGSSLWVMLSIELLFMKLFAVILGCMLTDLVHNPFLML